MKNGKLTKREEMFMKLRFAKDGGVVRTLQQVGKHMKITRQAAHYIQKKILNKLALTIETRIDK